MKMTPPLRLMQSGYRILPLAVLVLCLITTWLVWNQSRRRDGAELRAEFDFLANKTMIAIENHLESNVQVVRGVAGLFAASSLVERQEFREYVTALHLGTRYPGILGIGFSRLIPPGEKARHLQLMRNQGFPDYTIRPPGERDITTSTIFLEPFSGRNLLAFGYDMYTEPVQRTAMARACDEGEPAFSGKVTLVQDDADPQGGFLLYVPVYKNGAPHSNVVERRAALMGWAFSPLRMKEMLLNTLNGHSGDVVGSLLDVHVYDGELISPATLMFDSEGNHSFGPAFQVDRTLRVAGHLWTVRMHSRPPFDARLDSSKGLILKEGGIGLSTLLALMTWILVRSREKIAVSLAQADQANNDLKEMEIKLRDYSDNLERLVYQRTEAFEQANRELESSRDQADAANQAKSMFLATMSHELRTPLNAILGLSEMLQEGVMGSVHPDQSQALGTIEESGRHLLAVITDILDLSKIEADRMDLELYPVNLEELCHASLRFVKEPAHKKDITLTFTMLETPETFQTDPRRVKQILVNLLGNAIKFTPTGGNIGLDVVGDALQRILRFTVRDTGIGIAPDDLDRLFHPFVQVDNSLARRFEGTGLGLAMVARLTELLGGEVSVESKPGCGSSFSFTLPWEKDLSEVDPGADLCLDAAPPELCESFAGTPLILLVEDSRASREMLHDFLLSLGCRVETAETGCDAISLVQQHQPELILMDIQMPVMDGLTAIREIRALLPAGSSLPIIALTALTMPGDKERCLEAGADDYLGKPFRIRELQAKIVELLKKAKG